MDDPQDPLLDRTQRLLTDYLLFCAREPGTPEPPPTSVEAALLRSVTRQLQQENPGFFSSFRNCQDNRLELVRQMADKLLSSDQDFNWGRLVMLLAFTGKLMNQGPYRAVKQRRDLMNRLLVDRDCCIIVSLLCSLLMGRHRSRLEALGGWAEEAVCPFGCAELLIKENTQDEDKA
ncbi:bcl-2-like protein 10 isoform X2 [Mastomys coucha]|uniref:bcl-2-like protein 10 isoform X2 n=1 Tax=Mastomys coucha TaxID=35658 RepID=UPI00126210E1|nr:bcl-2-like protein 10 isoform X2 [Mastomys coucha]